MSAERNTTKEWGIGGDCWAIRRGEGNFKQNAAAGGGIERRRRRGKGRQSTLEVGEPEQLEAGSGEGRKQGSGRPKRDKAAPLPNRALD